jgi:homoaconitase/3-isopropylmalate dehydratase large subunit
LALQSQKSIKSKLEMTPRTFAEKIFNAQAGTIVFARPDIILTHDNTSSIYKTFQKMGGFNVADPDQMLVVLDHNVPPSDSKLATQYQDIRDIVVQQGIKKFYDAGNGICHQIMSYHARPGMIIVGSDSHTSTAVFLTHLLLVLIVPNLQVYGKEERPGSECLNQLK